MVALEDAGLVGPLFAGCQPCIRKCYTLCCGQPAPPELRAMYVQDALLRELQVLGRAGQGKNVVICISIIITSGSSRVMYRAWPCFMCHDVCQS